MARPCQEAGIRHRDAAPFSLSQLLSRNQLLRLSPSAQTLLSALERVVGSLLAAATVIGSNPAPLGACPLVSMATPLLSKHKGASFYEIIKPNFAVWVHLPSRGWGIPETKPGEMGGHLLTPPRGLDPVTHLTPPTPTVDCHPEKASPSHPSPVPSASPSILSSVFPGLCSPLRQAFLASRSALSLVPSAHQRPQAAPCPTCPLAAAWSPACPQPHLPLVPASLGPGPQ